MSNHLQMPNPTCPQAINSKTFRPPPVSPYLSVPEVFDWHFSNSRQHPFYVYHQEVDDGSKVTTITWGDAVKAIYRIANSVSESLGARKDTITRPVVGLYSSSESLTYMLAFMGIVRAGFPVFLISNRSSPATLEHLIATSGVTHILLTEGDEALSARLLDVRRKLKADVTVSNIPSWSELFAEGVTEIPPPVRPISLDDQCIIIHSSGSTALPELNRWTHRMLHNFMWTPWYGEKDICGEVMSAPSIPMGGPTGVMQALFPASSGIVISGFQPATPPISPTLENVWKSMIATQSTYGFIPQPFLAIWSEDVAKVQKLAKLRAVLFAGAPLSKDVGDKLAERGVNILTLYGASEAALAINKVFLSKNRGMDWEWFPFHPLIHPGIRDRSEDGVGELVLKVGPTHTPTRTNTVFDGVPAYATGDLLEAHPTVPSLWRYVSRVTDQETIGAGGPKINVVALARMLMSDPLIAGAVLVSRSVGISNAFGVIIEPDTAFRAHNDLTSPDAIEAFKDNIWPTIERYNDIAHDPARIFKKNIILASPSKPFIYGEKGMPRRKDVMSAYHPEIEALNF